MKNKKYGWTEKKSFEQFYKEQLIRLYHKVEPYKCLDFLNKVESLEDVSKEMDKCIANLGK